MENKPSRNGSAAKGPHFAFIAAQHFAVLTAHQIIETIEQNAAIQAKVNLAVGPLFRKVADEFRDWSKIAEPGWLFQGPEINLCIIRIATGSTIATSMSQEAQDQLRAAQEAQLPRIATP